ncbi:MAG: hypothetical protein K5765_09665 [Clostridia bacterium]|nr:hypothetical protein [Clostridia bacterium]
MEERKETNNEEKVVNDEIKNTNENLDNKVVEDKTTQNEEGDNKEVEIDKNSLIFKMADFYFGHFNVLFPIILVLTAGIIGLLIASIVLKWWWVLAVCAVLLLLFIPLSAVSIKFYRQIGKFRIINKILDKEFKSWQKTHPDMDIEYWKTYVLPSIASDLGLVSVRKDSDNATPNG